MVITAENKTENRVVFFDNLRYLVSQFLLKPFQRIAIAAAIMMFMIMAMIIRP
jgi:hypothetical protein